ncbi:NAD(P)-dependent oxidoreductase [Psychrobacillus lasiicapitis]|uniref:NAD(P)-dependent oxidoreductase n=1 Tax=Psychrobacillus lasiicapitis TaxID=1636719 RepID=A0A544T349_9BACI|nr:NAD(P)-dependent oxidoreductase [Psychrobacillus lasiicapitis]TQR11880.1 NAD(P)-dependent oxidoreductase [Psychrobacillus lasiicapitis]GGA20193.1 2-hydroxy-3-oxopropionate reductase [Psychrobacillus lasiicapitis]
METIGFIGLGNMGLPMTTNLIKAGYTVYGMDVKEEILQKFTEIGGKVAKTNAELAAQTKVIMTSLPTPQVVEAIYTNPGGLIETAAPGTLLIDFSTVDPKLNDDIAALANKNGLHYLGAPVSGGVIGAVQATLTIMVGGTKENYEKALPLLNVLGKNIFLLGDSPSVGTRIKLLNNLMIGFYTKGVAEMLVLAESVGLSLDKVYEILNVSYGQSKIYTRNYAEYMKNEDYQPGFSIDLLLKDMRLAQQMAVQGEVNLPVTNQLIEEYEQMSQDGFGHLDISAAYLSEAKTNKKEEVL